METEKIKKYIIYIVIGFLLAVSLSNQLKYNFRPFVKNSKHIPRLLTLDEPKQVKLLMRPLHETLQLINNFPSDTCFYFVPSFQDSGNTKIWWWYVQILLRYFSYPRKVYCLDPSFYDDDKSVFAEKYIRNARFYSELPWLKSRNVTQIILLRDNNISIFPVSKEIAL